MCYSWQCTQQAFGIKSQFNTVDGVMIHMSLAKYSMIYAAYDIAVREFEAAAYQKDNTVKHDNTGDSPRQPAASEGTSGA